MVRELEPIPHVDVHAFTKKLEARFWHAYYALRDSKADPSERVMSQVWFELLEVAREMRVPIPLEVLRLAHTSITCGSLVAELWPAVDRSVFYRYEKMSLRRRKRAGKVEARRAAKRQAGLTATVLQLQEDAFDLSQWIDNSASELPIRFLAMAGKGSYVASLLTSFVTYILIAAAIGATVIELRLVGDQGLRHYLDYVVDHPIFLGFLILGAFAVIRLSGFRLSDVEPR